MTCKAIYAITKKIPVNWSHIICHHLTHIKTKLFYGPLLTYLFIHYDIPLTHEPSLPVRTKPLDLVTINKMEQASGRARTSGPSSSSAPAQEAESSDEDQEGPLKEDLDDLRKKVEAKQIEQTRQFVGIVDWQYRTTQWQGQMQEMLYKIQQKLADSDDEDSSH